MINLESLEPPVKKGDEPLSDAQFARRMDRSLERLIPTRQRELLLATDPDAAAQLAQTLGQIEMLSKANNTFNKQLFDYKAAKERLSKYRLAEGREEVSEEVENGMFDEETGDPLKDFVVIQPAIEPLPAEVEQPMIDPDTGEVTGTEMVPNPLIVEDDTERAEAGAVVELTPQEVKDFLES